MFDSQITGHRFPQSTETIRRLDNLLIMSREGTAQNNRTAAFHSGNPAGKSSFAHQYGGNYKSGWLAFLPDSWLPYVQLARLSPPAGLFLIFFPHLFGILHAAILQQSPPLQLLQTSAMMLCGSFFFSNATHIWNDLIDAPLDARVERTRNRPIPRGAISPIAALVFTITQAIGAAIFLKYLPVKFFRSTLFALPSIIGSTYYPWAKVHTNFPQFVLGICLAWGVVMGSLAIGMEPFGVEATRNGVRVRLDYSTLCLFAAAVLWTMIYDTIYAHLDLEDDIKVGIKSMAVQFRGRTRPVLWQLLTCMAAFLFTCGKLNDMSILYYGGVGAAVIFLGMMIARVDLRDSQSCWYWFSNGFWFAGGFISTGLFMEYMHRYWLYGISNHA